MLEKWRQLLAAINSSQTTENKTAEAANGVNEEQPSAETSQESLNEMNSPVAVADVDPLA